MADKAFHFEVHGQCRDYDYSIFCSECDADAIELATEWLAEAFDAMEIDEVRTITVKTVLGASEVCYGSCDLAKRLRREEDADG